jgi:lysophospholipase L1-like esterase
LLAIVLVAGAILALAAEGVVRVRQQVKHGSAWGVEGTLTRDPATGLRIPIPNSVIGNIRINSLGFRGPEITVPKPAGTIRLAFLGGSTTYCAEVSGNDTTWPHLVWRTLRDSIPSATFDYVNAGVPGYSTGPLLQSLELRVKPLQPDVIVIYEATNDLSADSYALARDRGLAHSRPDDRMWLSRYSLLAYLVEKNVRILSRQHGANDPVGKLSFDPRQLSRDFERRLGQLVRASQASAQLVAVATFAPRLRRDLPPDERARAAVTALYFMPHMTIEGLLDGYEEYNRVIRQIAMKTGALLVDGERRIPPDDIHYSDSVHFKDPGSVLMAERVSGALLRSSSFASIVERKRPGS